jgi:hypothetical protein
VLRYSLRKTLQRAKAAEFRRYEIGMGVMPSLVPELGQLLLFGVVRIADGHFMHVSDFACAPPNGQQKTAGLSNGGSSLCANARNLT